MIQRRNLRFLLHKVAIFTTFLFRVFTRGQLNLSDRLYKKMTKKSLKKIENPVLRVPRWPARSFLKFYYNTMQVLILPKGRGNVALGHILLMS